MKRTCLMLAALADRMAAVKGPEPVRADRLLAAARGELVLPEAAGSAEPQAAGPTRQYIPHRAGATERVSEVCGAVSQARRRRWEGGPEA